MMKSMASVVSTRRTSQALLLVIAYLGFVSLGLPDPVAGVAWPSVRETFGRSQQDFGLVLIVMGCGYCASSFFGGRLIQTLGVGALLTASSALVAIAMFGQGAAIAWPMFAACAVIWGLGSGAIDAGLNAYVSSHFSARHVNWLHACYSLGATLGPFVMTAALRWAESWRLGYAVVGSVLAAMAVVFLATRGRWGEPPRSVEASQRASFSAALATPTVWLQVLIFFVYTALEFTIGQWGYTVLTESRLIETTKAGILVGCYFGAIGVGRVVFGAVANRVSVDGLVRASTLAILAGAAVLAFGRSSELALLGLGLTGLGLAPVFPCLMARTPQRVGPGIAPHAIGFQVSAAMLGASVLPALAGVMGQRAGLETVPQFALVLAGLLLGLHELLLRRGP
jgi:fucose permease